MTAVAGNSEVSAERILRDLLGKGRWALAAKAHGRAHFVPGDRICFYVRTVGVVAEAKITTAPEHQEAAPAKYDGKRFPWALRVDEVRYFFDAPIAITPAVRARLDAFSGKTPKASGAWFVQSSRMVTAHDFDILVGRK